MLFKLSLMGRRGASSKRVSLTGKVKHVGPLLTLGLIQWLQGEDLEMLGFTRRCSTQEVGSSPLTIETQYWLPALGGLPWSDSWGAV